MKKIFILTGEPSGDKLASTVISKLKSQNPDIESVCFTPAEKLTFISSSMGKELASYGGDISKFVHADIKSALINKFKN